MGIKCPKCHFDNPDNTIYCANCATPLKSPGDISVSKTKTIISPISEGSTVAGKYRIIGKLGEGGMGVVYKAEDTRLKRTVALKFMPPELTRDLEAKVRFVREAQAAAALAHPNICTIHEIDEDEGKSFIAMEYIEGRSIREKIKKGPLNLTEALNIAIQAAQGLEEAHKKGIVHRDIKSANIMVTEKGQAKIMDFGLAKVTGESFITKEATTMGTVAYMSPEQAKGETVDYRTDIWSLGVVLYEMISGQLPFKGDCEASILYSIEHKEPKHLKELEPNIPSELERVINKALGKNRDERYPNVEGLLDDLVSISKGLEPIRIKALARRLKFARIKRAYLYGGTSALIILLLGALWILFIGHPSSIDSIAVLPLKNLSGDPDQEYLSDGITDALINELAKISALHRVISRQSVMQYKGSTKSMPEIARELNVDGVVEASVLNIGGKVQIRVQLIFAPTEENLWAQNYDREMSDILLVQSEMARAIAEEIKVKIKPEEKARLASAVKISPEACELYLKGRFFLNESTVQSLEKSIECFQQAIDIEPDFASAYASLTEAYLLLDQAASLNLDLDAHAKSKEAALKALEIDDSLAEAHISIAFVYRDELKWEEAERELRKAIQLNPNHAMSYLWYSQILNLFYRHKEALEKCKRAQELDPFNPFISCNVLWRYLLMEEWDKGLEEAKKMEEMLKNHWHFYWVRGVLYREKEMYKQAIADLQKALTLQEPSLNCLPDLGNAYARAGKREEALKLLNKMISKYENRYLPAYAFAILYTGLGDIDMAFECLEKGYQVGEYGLYWFTIDTWSKPLRDDPRWPAFVKKFGLGK